MNHKPKYKFFHRIYLAISGIVVAIIRERHLKYHILMGSLLIIPGIVISIPAAQIMALISIVGILITMELLNTAIELTVDLATKQFSYRAKLAKDVASGAVLVTATLVLILSIYIYSPFISTLFTGASIGH